MNNILGTPRIDYIHINKFCALCGTIEQFHHIRRHQFVEMTDERRCKKCGYYYFQHTHSDSGCTYVAVKYIQ
jgi:hypothetical protein